MSSRARRIVQCEKNGKDLQVFSSVSEACLSCGITNKSNLYRAIKYGLVVKGYRFRYEDEPLMDLASYDMAGKSIIVSKGEVETEYPSLAQASKETGVSISHIQQCVLTGGSARGYRFRLKGETPKEKAHRKGRSQRIVSLDHDGNVVKEYISAKEAAEELGVHISAIYRCLENPKATCKGYRFAYR